MAEQPEAPSRPNQPEGPSWTARLASDSVQRIVDHHTSQDAQTQALTEAVILLHSIRRILIWTMVILPIVLAILLVTLGITTAT